MLSRTELVYNLLCGQNIIVNWYDYKPICLQTQHDYITRYDAILFFKLNTTVYEVDYLTGLVTI